MIRFNNEKTKGRDMAIKFCSIASGSSGNSYLIASENTRLLVDVGIAGKRVIEGIKGKGYELCDIDGILLTHEHIDHVKSIKMMCKKCENGKVYGSTGTLEAISDKLMDGRAVRIAGEQEITIGDIDVKIFSLSHDAAEPLGYSFCNGGKQLTIVTDTGIVTEEILEHVTTSDAVILEANHEVNILNMGSYPYSLKRRILGDQGHLSNEAAGKCLCSALNNRAEEMEPLKVYLAHLSKENNTPKHAYLTIRNLLFEEDYYIDKDIKLDIVPRDEPSEFKEV